METAPCAKCIKTGKAKPPKSRKNEKILYIYEFAPSKIPCFSGFSVNQVYKCEKVIHQGGPEKCRNLGLFFGSFGANGQNPAGFAGNANVRSNFCMNMQFPGRGAKKIFSKIQLTPYFCGKKLAMVGDRRQNPPFFSRLLGTGSQKACREGSKKAPWKGELFGFAEQPSKQEPVPVLCLPARGSHSYWHRNPYSPHNSFFANVRPKLR